MMCRAHPLSWLSELQYNVSENVSTVTLGPQTDCVVLCSGGGGLCTMVGK
jgi:hypothetical protein